MFWPWVRCVPRPRPRVPPRCSARSCIRCIRSSSSSHFCSILATRSWRASSGSALKSRFCWQTHINRQNTLVFDSASRCHKQFFSGILFCCVSCFAMAFRPVGFRGTMRPRAASGCLQASRGGRDGAILSPGIRTSASAFLRSRRENCRKEIYMGGRHATSRVEGFGAVCLPKRDYQY